MFPSNEILHGDCTRVLKQLPDAFVDLIVTDPPYGVRYQDRLGRTVANDDDPNRILGAFTDCTGGSVQSWPGSCVVEESPSGLRSWLPRDRSR